MHGTRCLPAIVVNEITKLSPKEMSATQENTIPAQNAATRNSKTWVCTAILVPIGSMSPLLKNNNATVSVRFKI